MSSGFPELALGYPPAGSSSAAWRDLAPLWPAVLGSWMVLASLSVGAGLAWRFIPGLEPPGMFLVLSLLAPLYWIAGLPLAGGARRVLQRQYRHVQRLATDTEQRVLLGLALLGSALLISLAPAGVLLAYAPWASVQNVVTLDPAAYSIRLGLLLFATMLLGGTTLTLLSAAVLLLGGGLSWRAQQLLWLSAGLLVNLRLVAGLSMERMRGWPPPTLGELSLEGLERFARVQQNSDYTSTVVGASIALPLLVLLGAVVLTALALWLTRLSPLRRPQGALTVASWAAVLAVCLRTLHQHAAWQADLSYRFPGDWQALFSAAALVLWAALLALGAAVRPEPLPRLLTRLAWLPAVLLAATICTLPNVRADQVAQPEVLRYALLWLAPLLAGVALCDGVNRLRAAGRGAPALLLVLAIGALLLPLNGTGENLLLRALELAEALPPPQAWTAWALLLAFALAGLVLGRLPRRVAPRRASAS